MITSSLLLKRKTIEISGKYYRDNKMASRAFPSHESKGDKAAISFKTCKGWELKLPTVGHFKMWSLDPQPPDSLDSVDRVNL